jgi:hypothetical protein
VQARRPHPKLACAAAGYNVVGFDDDLAGFCETPRRRATH